MSRALGRYELLRPLARGGMAEVFLARRRAAGVEKWLVVKRIRPERSTDVRFLDLFVKEARLSMSLAHQNIVPVFDFGRIDDQVFLAMERVEGKDLGACLARAADTELPPLPPLLGAFIAAECCQALDYAHHRKSPEGVALGIVHRDVTPRNVLLSWSGEVKLTDFGIASLAGDAGGAQVAGTPNYMAPEQARGEPVDARADLYAVGLVLREALTGQRARPGKDREVLLALARAGELVPWPERIRGVAIAPRLVAIVDQATALRPEDRYPDARTMLADLDAFIVGERATNRGDAPARALAAWLDTVWAGAREDAALEDDASVDAKHLVSFMDDGALDVVGTGTERSMLATAGDEPASVATVVTPPPVVEPSAAADAVHAPEAASAPPIAARRWLMPTIVAGGAAAIVLALFAMRAPSQAVATSAANDAVPAVIARGLDAGSPIASRAEIAEDAAPVSVPVALDAAIADRATSVDAPPRPGRPRVAHGETVVRVDAGIALVSDAALASGLRKLTINATPWAYFTVDSDPAQHQTVDSVHLAPGKHRIHFSNPVLGVERDVTVDVPADRDISYVENLKPAE